MQSKNHADRYSKNILEYKLTEIMICNEHAKHSCFKAFHTCGGAFDAVCF
jgi:hypothetical protein